MESLPWGDTDSNDEFINGVKEILAQGAIAKKTAQLIKNEIEKLLSSSTELSSIVSNQLPERIAQEFFSLSYTPLCSVPGREKICHSVHLLIELTGKL